VLKCPRTPSPLQLLPDIILDPINHLPGGPVDLGDLTDPCGLSEHRVRALYLFAAIAWLATPIGLRADEPWSAQYQRCAPQCRWRSTHIPYRKADALRARYTRRPRERRGRWKQATQLSGIDGVFAVVQLMSRKPTSLDRPVDGGLGDARGSGCAAWRVHSATRVLR
jgi:hypothetical protein